MPTCEHCRRHAVLRSRRPGQCCRKGHHRATVAREVGSTAEKRKAELIIPAAVPPPKRVKRANVGLVLPKAAEDEVRNPATMNLGNTTEDDTVIAQAPP
ncbi:hypothetical protein DIPPA_28137 [Diplonema papillatum]|nr:hypothetical protein DIPPA_01140 [Diplonema papillatum]KAJ9473455.1 hypothetical protein DIPPA_28137 [Diplonema papillatum]